jgi:CheY-specific phosphatase CheX
VIDPVLLTNAIEKATKEVFGTMLGAEVSLVTEAQSAPADAGVVSLVGLTGNWSGTGTFSCNPTTATMIAAGMLMLDPAEISASIDDDVLDVVAELTNMVVGNIKNLLEEELGEMAISIPTVVYGRNFRFKNFAGTSEETGTFEWDGQRFEVKICLAPTFDRNSSIRERLTAPAFTTS